MPRYELTLITRTLSKTNLSHILRRTATSIFQKEGVIRKIENLGEQELPYRMKAHAEWHTHGRYFLFDFYLSPNQLPLLDKELKLDYDVIRPARVLVEKTFGEVKKKTPVWTCWEDYEKPRY